MKYLFLTSEERKTLEQGYENHPKAHFRKRCQAILLSGDGHKAKKIAIILHLKIRTLYDWLIKWEERGIVGLMILPGRGAKPKLLVNSKDIVDAVKKSPFFCQKLKKNGRGIR